MREVLRARGWSAPEILRRAAIIGLREARPHHHPFLGGRITTAIDAIKVRIKAVDQRSGHGNTDLAMQEGWSTAGPLARNSVSAAGWFPNINVAPTSSPIQSELAAARVAGGVFLQKKADTRL